MYNYKELKEKKLAKIDIKGSSISLTIARFDQSTGEKKAPVIFILEKKRLENDKAKYERETDDIAEILKDIKALERRKK